MPSQHNRTPPLFIQLSQVLAGTWFKDFNVGASCNTEAREELSSLSDEHAKTWIDQGQESPAWRPRGSCPWDRTSMHVSTPGLQLRQISWKTISLLSSANHNLVTVTVALNCSARHLDRLLF